MERNYKEEELEASITASALYHYLRHLETFVERNGKSVKILNKRISKTKQMLYEAEEFEETLKHG